MIESTYSCSSLLGLVSSKRRLHLPPYFSAVPKFRQIDLAWPMCRYPLGSGGKRVCTCPANLPVRLSSSMIWWMKLREGVLSSAAIMVDSVSGKLATDGTPRGRRPCRSGGSSVPFILVESRAEEMLTPTEILFLLAP